MKGKRGYEPVEASDNSGFVPQVGIYDNEPLLPVVSRPGYRPEELLEARTCRICLDEGGADMIAPCMCSGTQKWVHRFCLNTWRAARPKAFSECNECHFQYRMTIKEENKSGAENKFKLLVARDTTAFIAVLLVAIGVSSVMAWLCDEFWWSSYIRYNLYPAQISWSPALTYTCCGLTAFLAFLGFCATIVALFGALCSSQHNSRTTPICDGPIICFWDDFMCMHNRTCVCCCWDCDHGSHHLHDGGSSGCGNCGDCSCSKCEADGDGAKILIVVAIVVVVVFALIGIFVLAYFTWNVFNKIIRRHYHVLHKKGLAQDVYIVEDLNGFSRDDLQQMRNAVATAPPVPDMSF